MSQQKDSSKSPKFWRLAVVKHRNGTEYIINETPAQCRIEAGNIPAYAYSERYCAEDFSTRLWIRPQTEMEDGRFILVDGGPYADIYAPPSENRVLLEKYLAGNGKTFAGYTLASVLALTDAEMEQCHDFIQWSFPLPEKSSVHGEAPIATANELHLFSREAKAGTKKLFLRFLKFLGLELIQTEKTFLDKLFFWKEFKPELKVVPTANFSQRRTDWLDSDTHNDLRITRVLRSLLLQGFTEEVIAFHSFLQSNCKRETPQKFWQAAITTQFLTGK